MANRESSFKYGEAFESFVEDVIFPATDFVLLHKTHSYRQNSSRYVWSSLKPDFTFKSIASGKVFHVEAKYRFRYDDDRVDLITPKQFQRYKRINTANTPVYLIVGTGGTPHHPNEVSLVPLNNLRNHEVTGSVLKNFIIPPTTWQENRTPVTLTAADYVSSYLGNIASGLTINRKKTRKQNLLPWILGSLVISVFLAFFITTSFGADDSLGKATIRERIESYYDEWEAANTDALDLYLNDHIDRWYDHQNVNRDFVKEFVKKYNQKYPIRRIEILWPTYKEEVLPNGAVAASFKMNYKVKSKPSDKFSQYKLAINSLWTSDQKIRSIHEVNLSN